MKWPKRQARKTAIDQALQTHAATVMPLPGIANPLARETLAMQLVASIRREDYFATIHGRGAIPAFRCDPLDDRFEAELGVVHLLQQGNFDEACWLVFLMTCFGKPAKTGWLRLRDVYGRKTQGVASWQNMALQPNLLEDWLAHNWQTVRGSQGSHRKYESIRPNSARPIGRALTQYVEWILAGGGHQLHFAAMVQSAGNSPEAIFDYFYRALPSTGFARLGRFDWVAMLDRYGMVTAVPETAYLKGATGPLRGVSLLFTGQAEGAGISVDVLQQRLTALDQSLQVGMKILEDALCNWQKNPTVFVHFKG